MQKNDKKKPERSCVGCGASHLKSELMRIVRTPDGRIVLDRTGKLSGRGAYICNDHTCFAKAKKAKKLERSLNTAIPDDVFVLLENEVSGNE